MHHLSKMIFNSQPSFYYVPPKQEPSIFKSTTKMGLNSPMIERVYKAKPGCSACGKKVA
jgi:hypothetical protein